LISLEKAETHQPGGRDHQFNKGSIDYWREGYCQCHIFIAIILKEAEILTISSRPNCGIVFIGPKPFAEATLTYCSHINLQKVAESIC